MSDWQPPKDILPWMVCAACRYENPKTGETYLFTGPRHWDHVMLGQYNLAKFGDDIHPALFDEGFVDQWGRFYQREDALKAVKASGQPFNPERNGNPDCMLFSEGLY